jgi:hypothetical protein
MSASFFRLGDDLEVMISGGLEFTGLKKAFGMSQILY